ncbi:unnamed protein product, partial [Polarella glacialis]
VGLLCGWLSVSPPIGVDKEPRNYKIVSLNSAVQCPLAHAGRLRIPSGRRTSVFVHGWNLRMGEEQAPGGRAAAGASDSRMTAAVAQPASALHLPRNRDGPDTRLLNRASRLSAVANAVGAIDLKQDGRGASSWWQGSSRSDSSSQSNRAASPVPWRVASTGDGNNNNNNNSNNNNYNNSNNNNYNNNYNDNNYNNNNNNNNNNNGVGKRASSPAGRRSGG